MTRSLVVVAVSLVAFAATSPQQHPIFRSATDAVAVDVSVRDRSRVISNLGAKDFELYDNGVRQTVRDVSFARLPIDVTIVLDVSLSVSGSMLDRLRRAVAQMMRDLKPDDRLKLITFNMRVARIVDFTNNAADVERAVRATAAGGGSSIWDAVSVALVAASDPERRQLVVLFSDGVDTSSLTTSAELFEVAQHTNAAVTAVVPATALAAGGSAAVSTVSSGFGFLRRLTAETGGIVAPVTVAGSDLTAIFKNAFDDFRSRYVLHFTPTGVERGGYHALEVKVPGNSRYTIAARRGYY